MKRRILLVAAIVGLLAPLGAAAVVLGPEPETLVEGHTVLALLQPRQPAPNASVYAAAVAVLVEEREERAAFRFPGVLWFNDQYLVNPRDVGEDAVQRWAKCTGTVFAVPAGAGNPVDAFFNATNGTNTLGPAPQYNESYLVTDPLDERWIVHRWLANSTLPDAEAVPIWTVRIMNGVTAGLPKEAADACAQETSNCLGSDEHRLGPGSLTDDECTFNGRAQREFSYNALLLIPLDLLTADGYKDHSLPNGTDLNDNATEGNSHAFNPFSPLVNAAPSPSLPPLGYQETEILRVPHGGSSDECLPATLEWRCHATYDIDVFFDERVIPDPLVRFNTTWFDVEGSTAPFLCESRCPGGS